MIPLRTDSSCDFFYCVLHWAYK
eukprot:COSAG04_NODE_26784_length_290_cov_1.785340_1_plen_22_part_10